MTLDGRLPMELRSVEVERRLVIGVCVPYNETSYLTPHAGGERIMCSAFRHSINRRGPDKIFLNREHNERETVGRSQRLEDAAEGLLGEFHIRKSELGDQTLEELLDGYWPYLSVGFRPENQRRAADGVVEVTQAFLGHVALVHTAAYAGAEVLAVRSADVAEIMAGFPPRPALDLSPLPNWR